MPLVRFEPSGAVADVVAGSTLLAAAAAAGVTLSAACGGTARCGRCRVRVAETERGSIGLEPAAEVERSVLGDDTLAAGWRLACRARVAGDVVVHATPSAATRALALRATGREPGAGERLGVAFDLGTTTLAAALVALESGEILAVRTADNPQRRFGDDVVSRLTRALDGEARELRESVAAALDMLAAPLAGQDRNIERAVLVGNPAMVALLLGDDVTSLALAPYRLPVSGSRHLRAREVGIDSLGSAPLLVPAPIGPFVGADVTAGVLAADLAASEYPTLYLDLGTNGELVLAAFDDLLAASAAAGPAFEAAGISSGMSAVPGAIERVRVKGSALESWTIGGGEPHGLCGSGLLDLVAALVESGVIDASGRILDEGHQFVSQVREGENGREFVLSEAVSLTQHDVRALQLAKAAVQTAIAALLEEAGATAEGVAVVVIAGGFGAHVDASSLAILGVIPHVWTERVRFAGNAALAGAVRLLTDATAPTRATELADSVVEVELATRSDFQQRFLAHLEFPSND